LKRFQEWKERGWKRMVEGVNSNMTYSTPCKNICKCHNVPPLSTIKNIKIINLPITGFEILRKIFVVSIPHCLYKIDSLSYCQELLHRKQSMHASFIKIQKENSSNLSNCTYCLYTKYQVIFSVVIKYSHL
jgi:hypothetical protein